jgi:hypothetical protein
LRAVTTISAALSALVMSSKELAGGPFCAAAALRKNGADATNAKTLERISLTCSSEHSHHRIAQLLRNKKVGAGVQP